MPDRLTGVCQVSSADLTYVLESIELDDGDRHILDMIEHVGVVEATIRYAEENREWAAGVSQGPGLPVQPHEIATGHRWLFGDPVVRAR